jgi:LmbE family N-acetylglucosaminyl deacetylase
MFDPTQPPIERVMALFAHPDDPEFFAGGALAKWGAEGKRLIYILATSGDKGTDDPAMTTARLIEIREAEQRAAAAVAGVTPDDVIFLRQPDGELMPDLALRRHVTRVIRLYRPDVVVTNDPTARWSRLGGVNHADHIAIGNAALDAIYPAARDRLYFPELLRDEALEPHKVRFVYLAGTHEPNTKIDITDYLDQKLSAIKQHASQVKDPAGLEKRLRDNIDPELRESTPRYTELYRVLTLR